MASGSTAKVVAVHSFRGGTGKSNLTANIAVQLAASGLRIGIVDADIQSPGIHVIFGLAGRDLRPTLNDHLFGDRPIIDAARDVTPPGLPGSVHVVPASARADEITRVLREGYDAQRFVGGLRSLIDELTLDVLLIDTHPGLQEETLLSLVIAHTVLVVLRVDRQDFEGTAITVDVAAQLEVPRIALVINQVPALRVLDEVRSEVERAYAHPVVDVLPHTAELHALGSATVFCLEHPDHPLTAAYRTIAGFLVAPAGQPTGPEAQAR